jgi:mono/diheme cytochrome c family protein
MPSRASVWTLLATGLGLASAGSATADEALAERGRIIAETYCGDCHATGPTGESPIAEAPPLRSFHDRWPVEHLAEALAEGIMVGHEEMPEFRMTAAEIDAFLAYLDGF